jgi:hypothetical protein
MLQTHHRETGLFRSRNSTPQSHRFEELPQIDETAPNPRPRRSHENKAVLHRRIATSTSKRDRPTSETFGEQGFSIPNPTRNRYGRLLQLSGRLVKYSCMGLFGSALVLITFGAFGQIIIVETLLNIIIFVTPKWLVVVVGTVTASVVLESFN